MQETFFQKFLKSPFTLLGSLVLFFMIMYHFAGMTWRLYSFYTEKRALEAKISELKAKTESVKKEIGYTQTTGFIEREGKSRLNLKKTGEEVVVIVPEKELSQSKQDNRSRWQKMLGAVVSFFGF